MKICIIGYTGFVGQTVFNYLSNKHNVFGINSKTKIIPKEEFDIVINCAGNAKKYLANKNPAQDFLISSSIFHTILQLKFEKLIHVSSVKASLPPNNNYTISKLISEKYCKLYFPNSLIVRLRGLIGPGLKKNIVFDITNNRKPFVTFNSIFNYISTQEIAKIIERIIKLDISKETINVSASEPISVKEIIKEAHRESIIFDKEEGSIHENYENISIEKLNSFFKVRSSHYYIKRYFQEIKKNLS